MRELSLCYDRARWPEAQRVAKRNGTVVLNIQDGRGADRAEAKAWDTWGGSLRSLGGITLGYVDLLNTKGIRKGNDDVIAEARTWIDAGHSGVFLDDARDRQLDTDVIAALRKQRPKALLWANPGTRCTGPLKASGAVLCESEKSGKINYASAIVIAFVKPDQVTTTRVQAAKSGVRWLALEPLATYHVAGIEYQKKNPFTP